jgi:hypothetical protein
MMYAAVSTDGQLGIKELENECCKGSWIPLCVLKHRETGEIYLPIFNLQDICRRFAVRNLPKEWSKGAVLLSQEDYLALDKKGWKFLLFDFPRLVNEDANYELTFEIHEFCEQPDFTVGR